MTRWVRRQWLRHRSSSMPRRPFQQYSIGIYGGSSPLSLGAFETVKNPVLTRDDVWDVPALYVADPFMVERGRNWYMFLEVLNHRRWKGEIGLALSRDGMSWTYQGIVLTEPFHLSYPHIFEWEGQIFMIPESRAAKAIRLYRSAPFPEHWTLVGTLLEGAAFADASIARHGDRWWLFVETDPHSRFDTLRLYHASDLRGPWIEHPRSPVVSGDPRRARPAGRLLPMGGSLYRFAQDCDPVYGSAVRVFEVMELTPADYRERELSEAPLLGGSGRGWNASGMHHVDAHPVDGFWRACVDGWTWTGGAPS